MRTTAERFRKYHSENPQVADRLEQMAQVWFAAGNDRAAINMLCEVLRWSHGLTDVTTDEPYRMPNDYRPHYARLLIRRHPEWADRIKTKELRTA